MTQNVPAGLDLDDRDSEPQVDIHILQSSTQSHAKSKPAAPSYVKALAVRSAPFSDTERDRRHV